MRKKICNKYILTVEGIKILIPLKKAGLTLYKDPLKDNNIIKIRFDRIKSIINGTSSFTSKTLHKLKLISDYVKEKYWKDFTFVEGVHYKLKRNMTEEEFVEIKKWRIDNIKKDV